MENFSPELKTFIASIVNYLDFNFLKEADFYKGNLKSLSEANDLLIHGDTEISFLFIENYKVKQFKVENYYDLYETAKAISSNNFILCIETFVPLCVSRKSLQYYDKQKLEKEFNEMERWKMIEELTLKMLKAFS